MSDSDKALASSLAATAAMLKEMEQDPIAHWTPVIEHLPPTWATKLTREKILEQALNNKGGGQRLERHKRDMKPREIAEKIGRAHV